MTFGQGDGKVPVAVTSFQATRDENDKRIYRFVWDSQENVTGYILRWGTQKEKLTHSMVVYDNQYEARYFNRDSEYYFIILPPFSDILESSLREPDTSII